MIQCYKSLDIPDAPVLAKKHPGSGLRLALDLALIEITAPAEFETHDEATS